MNQNPIAFFLSENDCLTFLIFNYLFILFYFITLYSLQFACLFFSQVILQSRESPWQGLKIRQNNLSSNFIGSGICIQKIRLIDLAHFHKLMF